METRYDFSQDFIRNIVKGNLVEMSGKVMTGEMIDSASAVIAECLNDHLKSMG